jgi:hypothetical protein
MRNFWLCWGIALLLLLNACGGKEQAPEPAPESPAEATATAPPEAILPHEATGLAAGVAVREINPEPGTWLGGYGHNRAATGIHDSLHARAAVFHDGETAVALVVLDALSIQYPSANRIRAGAAQAVSTLPLAPEHVIVQATHTHAAPDTTGIYGPSPAETGLTPAYMEKLESAAVDAVAEAAASLRPARLVWARTEGPDWAVNDCEPGVIDRTVTVLRAENPEGTPLATFTHFACHPTVLDGNTTLVSADWVGTFYARMQEAVPGEHFYLQGGIGAWIQPKTPERTFELAATYGADLAARASAALEAAQPVEGTAIRAANRVFAIPLQTERFRQLALSGLVERAFGQDEVVTEVAWFAVGNAQFATHPSETAPRFTWETHLLMDTEPKFVLGLAQDHLGYFNPPEYYDDPEAIPHAAYLTQMSPGRDAGPVMMRALAVIIP